MVKRKGSYPAAQALIDRAMKVDPALAADIRAFARSREYGLVFEHNRPEAMRLYGKPVNEGDVVHILPERGSAETGENRVEWNVLEVEGEVVKLQQVDDEGAVCESALADVVAVAEYDQPIYAGLREMDRVERGGGTLGDPGEKPYHVVINGENYHALEALEFCYAGKVDCIYIDPPYNTGAKDWKYNNDYVDNTDAYRHSKWLAWMERRLKLARALLNPESSVLILTIDEKEYLRIGMLLEQVFPEARIQMVSVAIHSAGVSRSEFSRTDEYYYFCFFGTAEPASLNLGSIWNVGNTKRQSDVRWESMLRSGNNGRRVDRPNLFYPALFDKETHDFVGFGDPVPIGVSGKDLEVPDGQVAVLPYASNGAEACWRISAQKAMELKEIGAFDWGEYNAEKTTLKYLKPGELAKIDSGEYTVVGKKPNGAMIISADGYEAKWTAGTQWTVSTHQAGGAGGSVLLKNIYGDKRFDFPKSVFAVRDSLKFVLEYNKEALVLDFFAGSGTTLHAVSLLNAEDGGSRRCICVTNNEVSADEAKDLVKAKVRQGDADWEKLGIARYVTWPRAKCVIRGIDVNGKPLKGDYGCSTEVYKEYEGEVVDPETGKKKRKKLFEKVKEPSYPELANLNLSDGFEENALFFDLTYEDPDMVSFGMAFDEIAPLLWMRAGCRGRIIEHEADDFAIADNYAVLFEYACMNAFSKAIKDNGDISTVFVVTDDDHRFANAKKTFPGHDVVRLYESYLHSFQIASEGALS